MTSRWYSPRNQNDQMKIAISRIVTVWLQKLGMKKLGTCCCLEWLFVPDRQEPALAC